ncbi:MAG: histidinol-phosphate transaminase [Fuerstiella sp.]|jgi:histidinol-phosphate aminotransferase|nr:histidinol-phosphate transaminase [Fuerstiella sp.]MCP4511729.1 histidinol-phosphate transaminase [Fuerstiella sp.]MDG2131797.1 histidinol-phosphate transaminase [Fuerstiella sp.]
MNIPFRKSIKLMDGYVSGEQPQGDGWVKLNTNENPYPPSPKVVAAIKNAANGRLNVYPDASATQFRNVAGELFGVSPDWILPANGSDENLTIIIRSFCNPHDTIAYPYPSYVLYESLARIQNCQVQRLRLNKSYQWDAEGAGNVCRPARIVFAPNPNSPTGNRWTAAQLHQLLPNNGMLVVDEAYGDFAAEPHRGELLKDKRFDRRIIVTRTLSKSYSLAGIRFGFSIADPEITSGMQKVRDSYNCDTIATAAATAALQDQDWMLRNREQIICTRNRMLTELPPLGFSVCPSQANFVWAIHETGRHQQIFELLKRRRILVRFMQFPNAGVNNETLDGLRITVGTDDEVEKLLNAMRQVVAAEC